jgi:Spy/CpxP family protein refolding chaperone
MTARTLNPDPTRPLLRSLHRLMVTGAVALALVHAPGAHAEDTAPAHAMHPMHPMLPDHGAMSGEGYGGAGGAHGHGMGMGMGMEMGMGMGMGLTHLLARAQATPEQRAQIKTILKAARTELEATRGAGRTLHQQMMQALVQPTLDDRAVEGLRQQIQANHEAASKRMTQALLDASRVLTPEQRKSLGERMARHQSMMDHHGGDHAGHDQPPAK